MTPDSLLPRPSPARLLDSRLAVLVTDLRRRDLRCQILRICVLGEQDVRVEVCRDGGPTSAELLWCGSGTPSLPGWHAVRVDGAERAVWRGPGRNCPRPVLVEFLVDLVTLGECALHERYRLLG